MGGARSFTLYIIIPFIHWYIVHSNVVTKPDMHHPLYLTGCRQALLSSTAPGGLLLLSCFWEDPIFLRLVNLAKELGYRLPHVAGLNPRAFKARYCKVAPALGGGYASGPPLLPDKNGLLQVGMQRMGASSLVGCFARCLGVDYVCLTGARLV